MQGKITPGHSSWKELENRIIKEIEKESKYAITDKGKNKARLIFRKYMTNKKLNQKDSSTLIELYPLYLISEGRLLDFIELSKRFETLTKQISLASDHEKYKKMLLDDGSLRNL